MNNTEMDADKTIDFYLKEVDKLNKHIQSLESQLNIEWDEEWIREVENNLERYDIGWSDYPHVGVGEIRRFLSLLKKEKREKKGLEYQLKLRESILCPECLQTLEPDESCLTCRFATKVKELEKGIEEIINSGYMNSLIIKYKLRKLMKKE
jgi:hypothetical protein